MRRLFPTASADELSDEDLLHTYAYPADRTWFRANMVASLDGVATMKGLSEGLSGAGDKRVFALLRVLADVVVAGAGTVRTENYAGARVPERFAGLRASKGQQPVPPIALVSRQLGLDPDADVFTTSKTRPIVLTCAAANDERRAALSRVADVVVCGETDVDPVVARTVLEERGLRHILCEGGPTLLHDLLAARVLDELCLTISGTLVGGGERHVVNGDPFDSPVPTRLAGLIVDEGVLLSRYVVDHPGIAGGA